MRVHWYSFPHFLTEVLVSRFKHVAYHICSAEISTTNFFFPGTFLSHKLNELVNSNKVQHFYIKIIYTQN